MISWKKKIGIFSHTKFLQVAYFWPAVYNACSELQNGIATRWHETRVNAIDTLCFALEKSRKVQVAWREQSYILSRAYTRLNATVIDGSLANDTIMMSIVHFDLMRPDCKFCHRWRRRRRRDATRRVTSRLTRRAMAHPLFLRTCRNPHEFCVFQWFNKILQDYLKKVKNFLGSPRWS